MGAALRNALAIIAGCGGLLFFVGFIVTTPAAMPSYALVYLDEANNAYLAPQCVGLWRRHATENSAQTLRRSNAGEARAEGFHAEGACAQSGAFSPPGPSLSRRMLERAGVIGPMKQWWDAPYRTEHGMVYPPKTAA